ncbi:formate dehydrogenase accessory sulfurtransferase FdhD [Desertibacillus haloalkaliphilus]|uniref:formate dehydrogenase accessory sulfurtransferase FdhD n=1 Tax=Desertibacillus haloalkaliphilus TaxID=1328930 RepID=UPI001C25DEEB|nr:formate dehydrogenase accessory sulfurtransferase FdhD [Desertibacillus haloalkaliphilus]MBU8908678.1 formate dehydrogenase accessory sulfurtransferase FdhD [Desertibacillus haloalkaliphilus]
MDKPIIIKRPVYTYDRGTFISKSEKVVTEYPLTIQIHGEEFATVVCTPKELEEMVVGFLASEGIIRMYDKDVKSLSIDEGRGMAYVTLNHKPDVSLHLHSKRFIGSCCGNSRQSFYFHHDVRTAKTSLSTITVSAESCFQLMESLQQHSDVFKETGGVHSAAICNSSTLLVMRSDIGRHNALDKLYGYCLMNKISVRDKILVFSGRISSEVLLKAAKIGIGIVLSKSAPTNLALEMAEELNMTTVGFIRGTRMNIYTHPERIVV